MPYQYVLFDLDNTLLDFDLSSHLSWVDIMKKYGLPSDDEHHQLYSEINQRLWSGLEQGTLHQDQIKIQRWADYFDSIGAYRDPEATNHLYFDGLARHIIKIDGADELIDRLQDRELAIVTNGIGAIQRRRLAKTGWLDKVKLIVISDEIGVAKPHRRIFDHTFDHLNLSPSDKASTIIIGDTLKSDIKGGLDYGISTCWFNPKQKKVHGPYSPTYEATRIEDLLQLLLNESR